MDERTRKVSGKVKSFHETLSGMRATHEWHWQEIADYMLPAREFTTKRSAGEKRMQKVYDSTPITALWTAAAGLNGLLTSPSVPWFALDTEDENLNDGDDVKLWLEDSTLRMYSLFNDARSNFNNAVNELYLDVLAFGTGIVFREKLDNGVRFRAIPLSECYIDEGADGRINMLIRKPKMATAKFMVENFGIENVSTKTKEKYQKSPFDLVEYIHCVYPREAEYIGGLGKKGMPFASIYMECETGHIIREGGFKEFPYVVARLTKQSGEVYGTGRGALALPDVKMLNAMMAVVIKSGQLAVGPPLQAPDDGFLEPIKMSPFSVNYYRAGTPQYDRIQPIDIGARPDIGLDMVESTREAVRKAFFNDVFMLRDGLRKGTEISATEAIELRTEKMGMLGPIGGRMEAEFLGPIIDVTFSAMLENRMFKRPPDEMSGANLKVKYMSPMANAQRQTEANGINQTLQFIMQAAQVDPSVVNTMNMEEAARRIAYLRGAPMTSLRTRDEVAGIREQQAQQQQMMAEAQMAETAASALQKGGAGAKSLNEAQIAGTA